MKKIAFIKIGNFSGYNNFALNFLKSSFPDHDIEVIDIWKDCISYGGLLSWFHALREFGPGVLWDNYGTAVLRTEHFYRAARQALSRHLNPEEFLFSFQTGSFFDGFIPGLPHFVYIDASLFFVVRQFPAHRPSLSRFFFSEYFRNRQPGRFDRIRKEIAMNIQEVFLRHQNKAIKERAIYEKATGVFTMSEFDREVLISHYQCPPEKVMTVFSGPHVVPGPEDPPRPYERQNILFIGSEWERKGGPELAAAFMKVKDIYPRATLTVIGCSPPLKMSGCRVLGKIPQAEISRYYCQASIFCVPARVEAFGNVFIEAQYFQLPVVATQTGAIPEIVKDGQSGILVAPGDSGALARALINLLGDPSRCQEFGKKGRVLIQENYSWEQTERRLRAGIQSGLCRDSDGICPPLGVKSAIS